MSPSRRGNSLRTRVLAFKKVPCRVEISHGAASRGGVPPEDGVSFETDGSSTMRSQSGWRPTKSASSPLRGGSVATVRSSKAKSSPALPVTGRLPCHLGDFGGCWQAILSVWFRRASQWSLNERERPHLLLEAIERQDRASDLIS